jgi:hypothetical protein
MYHNKKIGIIIPCYNVKRKILNVLRKIPYYVDEIVCVDDFCPQHSGEYVKNIKLKNLNLNIIFNKKNLGVGGAVLNGYKFLLKKKCDIFVKIDGDDQMNLFEIKKIIKPIIDQNYDYSKGNRFLNKISKKNIPFIRLCGNYLISILSKITTGYWDIFDFLNGYTAISSDCLKKIIKKKVEKRFFFETDMLFKLYNIEAKVADVSVCINYNENLSNFFPHKEFFNFFYKNIYKYIFRLYQKYFFSCLNIKIFILLNLVASLCVNMVYNMGNFFFNLNEPVIFTILLFHMLFSILLFFYIDITNNPNLKK